MKLKTTELDGETYAVIENGMPVYVDDDGKETPLNAPEMRNTISSLNYEAQSHREAKEKALKDLKAFEGLDAAKAKDAIAKLADIDANELIKAGDRDAAIAAAIKPLEEQIASLSQEKGDLANTLNDHMIGGAFSSSKYAADNLAIPADIARSFFGQNFKVEDGSVVAYDAHGNKLYSPSNPGNLASFDEALKHLVSGYAHKDSILKGAGSSGGGAKPGAGGSGPKTMTRAEFDQMDQGTRAAKMADGFKIAG
ncbi:DUF6651 domain-containing protein [Roseibium sp. RKSG952]|uniref:DUF6651 domain-containing protein n=1 Tax=Roseibium sp. RKSG952 TaxID=2529384 RepID=UPI0012BBD14E|nr:DUF6651 domain-containing protein [Roseibium sp. RKSG952]MTH96412.1 hypothetical protein [Roseibium sp. RKSG952]